MGYERVSSFFQTSFIFFSLRLIFETGSDFGDASVLHDLWEMTFCQHSSLYYLQLGRLHTGRGATMHAVAATLLPRRMREGYRKLRPRRSSSEDVGLGV